MTTFLGKFRKGGSIHNAPETMMFSLRLTDYLLNGDDNPRIGWCDTVLNHPT